VTNETKSQKTAVAAPAVDGQLLAELVKRAQADGVSLTGEGGLLQQLTKVLLESALEGEMDSHLGYAKHDAAGRDAGNSRNGKRAKTVLTEVGPVEIDVPRDRDASFAPQIVKKRQRRLDGVDGMVLSLSAKGLTTGEISAHLAEIYGASVSKDTISAITDRVLEGMSQWQSRPLDPIYPVIFIDAIRVKIRDGQVANRPIYLALGVTVDGERDILGLWAGEHGDGEGAKYWMRILTEIKNRGVQDVLMLVCDGLKGLPDAVNAVWADTVVQTCVVHRSRKEIRCCFCFRGWMRWYGRSEWGPRAVGLEIRGVVAASERAAAAVAAGGRGSVAGAWRSPSRRGDRRCQRDHGPQGRVRVGGRRRAARGWAGAQARGRAQAGRPARSGVAGGVAGAGRA
jgi:hypothetical protein